VVLIVLSVALSAAITVGPAAKAADGTILRTITAQNYSCSVGTGIAFDGTNLLLSCNDNNKITAVSPLDGSFVTDYEISGIPSIGAIAWDRSNSVLWACGGFSGDDHIVYVIDLAKKEASEAFSGGPGCVDGLAYDATDNSLWLSPDVSPTVYHYKRFGELIQSYPANLGSCGNSGLAIGGRYLFLANNGCSEIYRADRADPAATELFGTYSARLEDMECDDVSFRTTRQAAIWSKDAYDAVLNAFELNPGDCGYGGAPPIDETDTDEDGLPDSWETYGLRAEAGLVLIDLPGMGAKPDHKDIFLRIDAEQGAELSKDARRKLVRAYAQAPVTNHDGRGGINLHIETGPRLTRDDSDRFKNTVTEDGKSVKRPNYDKIFSYWTENARWLASVYHYAISVHWSGTGGLQGQSSGIPAQLLFFNMCGSQRLFVRHCPASSDEQAVTVMHELGHNLGLRHGGGDGINYKPNYLSIMNYSFSVDRSEIPGIGMTYSRWGPDSLHLLDEKSLSEDDGVLVKDGSVPARARTIYYCPKTGKAREARVNARTNWNCEKGIQPGRIDANINYPKKERDSDDGGVLSDLSKLEPFNDWAHLQFTGGNIGSSTVSWQPGVPVA
jgi:hypothetical protein